MAFRVTYSVLNADLSQLHKEFDATLAQVKLKLGQEYPSMVAGQPVRSGDLVQDFNPARRQELLAQFHSVGAADVDRAVEASRKAQKSWGATPWAERAKLIRKAADLISGRNLETAAIMALETGKNRLESLGDVEEAADLFRYYATQLEEANGFDRPLGALSPNEKTRDVLRPFGVFAVISPFNFPMALAAGMSGGALLGGNSVILKPSQETPWCAQVLYEALRDAGLPFGVFQILHGRGADIGRALVAHKGVDGIAFTGSKKVGMEIWRSFSPNFIKPCYLELGGKNATIVSDKADLEKAIEGCARSAFGLSGQKCSALSRVYVHESRKKEFVDGMVAKIKTLKMGDPLEQDVFLGPVINETAQKRFYDAVAEARRDGKILAGGEDLRAEANYRDGYFCPPTLVEVAHGHRLSREEIFAPFLTLHSYRDFTEAVTMVNDSDYGLTSGIFSEDAQEVERFMDQAEAGILYANRRTGATTGAWPGVQSFTGWKGSGGSGKGGCGPYYVSQFMREQSQTRMGS